MSNSNIQTYKNYEVYVVFHDWDNKWEAVVLENNVRFRFYSRDYGDLYVKFTDYIDKLVADKEEEKDVQEVLAQDLFNDMLYNYPQALPEVIELLDQLQDKYKNETN